MPRTLWRSFSREVALMTPFEMVRMIAVFLVIFGAAKLGQHIFFEWRTSPAILWPPTGIALAVLWLWGYRYAVPIFLGLFAASLTGPAAHLIPAVVTTPLGQTLGSVVGVYFLHRFGFHSSFSRMRNVLIFLVVVIVTSAVAPSITTAVSALTGNLSVAAYLSWSRSWAGYLLSMLILTPLIIAWSRADYASMRGRWIEPLSVGILLVGSVYVLFWRPLPEYFSFLAFVIFFLAHFWVCLRFPTMVVMTSLSFTTVFGVLGLFVNPSPDEPLNEQLFAAELFLFLVVPIFYSFSALVKERAYAVIELREALKKIERENIIKSDFIAVLAHELRNPLAPVKTTLEILELQPHDHETQELISSAHRQIYSMRRLLDDLLDVTRVNQGRFELKVGRVSLCMLIDHAIKSTKALFDRGHTFEIEPSCDPSLVITADAVRLEQALVNLLNNAAKYTEPGGRITISHSYKSGVLEIMVTDTGIGISPENLKHIFEPFWQAGMLASPAGGIGIGLSLTRHIVELHGGTIKVASEGVAKGSAFTITLPIPHEEEEVATHQTRATDSTGPSKILVVDDNEAAANSLVKLLKLKGHEATASYSGTDALVSVKEYAPRIVILDIGLPDMSGYEVAATMRKEGFAGKIVALSGYGQQEDRERSRDAGCDEHFIKPMSITRLDEYLVGIS